MIPTFKSTNFQALSRMLLVTVLILAVSQCNNQDDNTSGSETTANSSDSWPAGPYAYYKLAGSGKASELYAKPLSGEDARLISEVGATDIGDKFVADPKSERVYFLQQDGSSKWHLYLADMNNKGKRKRLSRGGSVDATASNLQQCDQSDRIFYIADEDVADQKELYMIEMTNPDVSVKVNAPLAVGTDVRSFQISPNCAMALYRVDNELHLVDLSNPSVSSQLSNPGVMLRYDFSLDSTKAVFNTFVTVRWTIEMYVVDVSAPATSNMLTPTQNGKGVFSYQFLPDSDKVIYTSCQDATNLLEMFVLSVSSPGVSTQVHPAMVTGGTIYYDLATMNNDSITDPIVVSPDATKVMYAADMDTDETVELYMTDLSNLGTVTKLSPALVTGSDVSATYQWTADGNGVVYVADQDTDGVNELYYVSVATPGLATKLNPALVAGGNVSIFDLTIHGNDVYYRADQEVDGVERLYKVSINNPGVATQVDDAIASDSRTIQKFVVGL